MKKVIEFVNTNPVQYLNLISKLIPHKTVSIVETPNLVVKYKKTECP